MEKMIDWWTVPGETWGVGNLDFKVELFPDDDLATKDFDGYTEWEQVALIRGDWQFVRVVVTPVDKELTDRVYARQERDAVEWGEMPIGRVDRQHLLDTIKELAERSVIELMKTGFEVEATEGSDFAPERLTAPF